MQKISEKVYRKNISRRLKTLRRAGIFDIEYTKERKLITNSAIFDFESCRNQQEGFKYNLKTKWIVKQIPNLVPILSNLFYDLIFCNASPHAIAELFRQAMGNLAAKTKQKSGFRLLI